MNPLVLLCVFALQIVAFAEDDKTLPWWVYMRFILFPIPEVVDRINPFTAKSDQFQISPAP